jgi:signal transduction histidine kinase
MKPGRWQWLRRMPEVLSAAQLEPAEQTRRDAARQRHIFLPARLIIAAVVLYQFFYSPWRINIVNPYGVVFETIQRVMVAYGFTVLAATVFFWVVRRFPAGSVQWFVFFFGLADALFLGGLTILTGGFESILYWVYPALIILNAASIPLATPQIVLNLILGIIFLTAGLIESTAQPELELSGMRPRPRKVVVEEIAEVGRVATWLQSTPEPFRRYLWDELSESTRSNILAYRSNLIPEGVLRDSMVADVNALIPWRRTVPVSFEPPPEPEPTGTHYVLQVAVLVLLTFCCYGVQVLAAGQRRAEIERNEFIVRTEQLRSAGRLAAEVAHQIKNPLTIINNVTFSLQKKLAPDHPVARPQIEIIREEVAKVDRIITQIMGYAQLTEGRVEKLNVVDELNRVLQEVFPPEVPMGVQVHREFAPNLPPLLMQRKHFADAVSNLLQNARDAAALTGHIQLRARFLRNDSIEISVQDDGPGIPPDKRERIFEAYYTTKERGSGLGLSVVKHNTELYGGTVRVESELGKGAKFVLTFPSKTLITPLT